MVYELVTRYEAEAREPLDLLVGHALARLAIASRELIAQSKAEKRLDFVFAGHEYTPVLPTVPGVPAELHAERTEDWPESWFVAAYLPTVRGKSRKKTSMNFATYSVTPYPGEPRVADVGRYFWSDIQKGTRTHQIQVQPKQLTPRAVLEALVTAVELLGGHYDGMEEYWRVK
jgi:hypothetical protein